MLWLKVNALTEIRFRFTGGIAENNEMNFYEFGRFQYGAARFIYTLEKFRQDGKVIRKLNTRVHTDIRVKAAAEGSFIQDIVIMSLPIISECAIQAPFAAIFAYVWNNIIPPSNGKDVALEFAKIELERERERTLQESQRTKQLRVLSDVVQSSAATAQQALEILGSVELGDNSITVLDEDINQQKIEDYKDELQVEIARSQLIERYSDQFDNITPEMELKLSSQLRKSFNDIAKPLHSSAESMEIYAEDNYDLARRKVAYIDVNTAMQISGEKEDQDVQMIRGSIKSYDREGYNGKLRYDELSSPIPFIVRSSQRSDVGLKILQAMAVDSVWFRLRLIRDVYGTVTRASLMDIFSDSEYDDLV